MPSSMSLVVASLIPCSGIWTLLIGACIGVEKFTLKKLIGVFACFAGVVLTSGADISGDNDKNRGSFPHKSHQQISIGDALALLSAVLYGRFRRLLRLLDIHPQRMHFSSAAQVAR